MSFWYNLKKMLKKIYRLHDIILPQHEHDVGMKVI